MIRVINGNIFNGTENILCHQTNCIGIMGGGIALQVRNRFPKVFEEYQRCCLNHEPSQMLGKVQFCDTGIPNHVIANCFGQERIGSGLQTDYQALEKALQKVLCQQGQLWICKTFTILQFMIPLAWNKLYSYVSLMIQLSFIHILFGIAENHEFPLFLEKIFI